MDAPTATLKKVELRAASPQSLVVTVDNDSEKDAADGKYSCMRKATDPPAPCDRNWALGELNGALIAAPTHWVCYRGSETHVKLFTPAMGSFFRLCRQQGRPILRCLERGRPSR